MSTEPTTPTQDPAILLVDLSSIAHPIWHVSASEPDPNATSTKIVERVRQLATAHPHAAICVDSGKSFRAEVDPTYKANRPAQEATLHHQIALAVDRLTADGFPIWKAKGFEADDLIATACARALAIDGATVIVASADKDLLQLVQPRVRAKHPGTGQLCDEDGVVTRFGVLPQQMRDYLCLVGDASDNVKGADRIGPKTAAALLSTFGSLDTLYKELDAGTATVKPATLASLTEFRGRLPTVRTLIEMRTDAPIAFDEVLAERTPRPVEPPTRWAEEDDMDEPQELRLVEPSAPPPTGDGQAVDAEVVTGPTAAPAPTPKTESQALIVRPSEYERQLDPCTPREVRLLAQDLFASRMFSAYGTPEAVLSTIQMGRELGLPAMASLRTIHIIEGKHALSAALMVALVMKSGLAEYFEPVEFDHTKATFVTKRKGARKEISLTHTIEMAGQAGLLKDKSAWMKVPTDMLIARAQARLARLVYGDLLAGVYTPEELAEIREAA